MLTAAERGDFEAAAALRNEWLVLRQAGGEGAAGADYSGLTRQQPGAMGIGTRHRRVPRGGSPRASRAR